MDVTQIGYAAALMLCIAYASLLGGRTGRAGSLIVVLASVLTGFASTLDPTWADTSYAIFAVDSSCLLALATLAIRSSRFWPIWAAGFQTVAVATHIATMLIPDFTPKAYHALLSFWSIPILWVMVAGTRKDWNCQKAAKQRAIRLS